MKKYYFLIIIGALFAILVFAYLNGVETKGEASPLVSDSSSSFLRTINYNGLEVDVVVEKSEADEVDVLLAFHGTVMEDSKIIRAAKTMLEVTRKIIKNDNILIISVAYPEEGLLMGDNIKESEAVLLWVKNKASAELGVKINKIFLIGHSQGGYLVTRLNTMHETDGVIANGAGPIDLVFRCELDESGKIKYQEGDNREEVCLLIKEKYGSVLDSPTPYTERSMINFSSGYKSKILFVQGLEDGNVQLALWPKFKEKLKQCTDCAEYKFFEVENFGHGAAFSNVEAIELVNNFLAE